MRILTATQFSFCRNSTVIDDFQSHRCLPEGDSEPISKQNQLAIPLFLFLGFFASFFLLFIRQFLVCRSPLTPFLLRNELRAWIQQSTAGQLPHRSHAIHHSQTGHFLHHARHVLEIFNQPVDISRFGTASASDAVPTATTPMAAATGSATAPTVAAVTPPPTPAPPVKPPRPVFARYAPQAREHPAAGNRTAVLRADGRPVEIDGPRDAIARGIAYAEYSDLIWWETAEPNLEDAQRFAMDRAERKAEGQMRGCRSTSAAPD